MKGIWSYIKKWSFVLGLVICFFAIDTILSVAFDRYILSSGNFWLNDYEVTCRDHPEEVWDKVFFGNSSVTSGYREDLSTSGYVGCGIVYGMVRDLEDILRSDEIIIGSELVLGLNWVAMFDNMETNPTYAWHRGLLEPYAYFQRDRLSAFLELEINSLLTGEPWVRGYYQDQQKAVTYGAVSQEELEEKVDYYTKNYWSTGIEGCQENLAALKDVIDLCAERGLRFRVVIMPWNPSAEMPDVVTQLYEEISSICQEREVEMLDLTWAFDADCFHDLGHINYEYGSYEFMEVIDPWLAS